MQTAMPSAPTEPTATSHPALQRLRFTLEQFHRLGALGFFDDHQKYELIEGDIYTMPPEGPEHSVARTRLTYRFVARLPEAWHVRVEAPLQLGDSEVLPDLAIVPGRVEDYQTRHPTTAWLVVEVASTSLLRDRELKLPLYAKAGIPEYWIVNLQEKVLEVYREPEGERYKLVRYYMPHEHVAPLFAPEWTLPAGELLGTP